MSDSSKFIITEKQVDGPILKGFKIKNIENKYRVVSLSKAIQLARSGNIENAHVVLNEVTGEYIINVDGGLKSIPNIKNKDGLILIPVGRIINSNNRCIGYVLQDQNGKSYRLSLKIIWNEAKNGSIKYIHARINNGNKVLVSDEEFNLSKLPKISIDS